MGLDTTNTSLKSAQMLPPSLACVLGLELLLCSPHPNILGAEGIGAAPLTPTRHVWDIQLYSADLKSPRPGSLLPPGLPPPLPSANDDVEADRAGSDLRQLPPSLIDFSASDITFPSLVTVFPDSSF